MLARSILTLLGTFERSPFSLSALQVILAQLKALEAAERVQDARRGLEEAEEEFLGMVDEQV